MSLDHVAHDSKERAAIHAERAFVDELSRNPATLRGELESVARLITATCARLLDVERVGLWLFEESETELRCIDLFTLSTGHHRCGDAVHEESFRSEFQWLKRSLYVDANDAVADPRTSGYYNEYLKPNRITSMLDVVIRFGGRNLGTLCFEHVDHHHDWQQHEIDFGCLVGAQLSLLMERQALQRSEKERRETQERLRASEELDALKNRFFANVSHELRTPLTLLFGPVEDLLAGRTDAPSPWQHEQLAMVHRNAVRLLNLVNSLLDFVRFEAGRAQAVFEPVDLATLTRDIVGQFDSVARAAHVGIRVEHPELAEPAYVDAGMWEKIVLNLVSNAVKFTFKGEIVVCLGQTDDRFELVVRDTGIGIPNESLPHVFERFYRDPNAQGRSAEGFGIGLALTKEIAELHGGDVSVESTVGVGSTFKVTIPRGKAHLPHDRVLEHAAAIRGHGRQTPAVVEQVRGWLAEEPQERPAAVPREGRPRVLVVDDNIDMRAYLSSLLSIRYDVELAVDGADALEKAQHRPPDLVLSDVMMPKLDGVGLLRALRGEFATSTIPVIMVSARAGEEAALEALAVGADDYLFKPFSGKELLARVHAHIELARVRREAAESRLKDTFFVIASHELRTPLAALKLRLDLVQKQIKRNAAREATEQLGNIHRNVARMERLLGEMLDATAIRAGSLPVRRKRCDLVEVCREAAAVMERIFGRAVTCALPRSMEAMVDCDRIGEVVENLLSNALKFSPRDRPVSLSLREVGSAAEISVCDQGPGIPDDKLRHIFERFYRVPGIEPEAGSTIGFGLGLFVAKALVDGHGGSIQVDTKPGKGTTFRVTLPREPNEARPRPAEAERRGSRVAGRAHGPTSS